MSTSQPPLREPTYYTLVALLDGPLHGYGIMKRAKDLSKGRVHMTAGTLYAALDRLAASELVTVNRQEIVGGRARRYFRLTGIGTERVEAESRRLAEAAELVSGRRRLSAATAGAS